MSRLIRITCCLLLASTASAEIYYKWEKDGTTQYTKEKPRDVPYEEIRTTGSNPRSASESATAAGSTASKPVTGGAAEKAAPVKKDPDVCKRAKENLETLQSAAIVRMKDEYGKEVVMDDKQRENEMKKAQEAIRINC